MFKKNENMFKILLQRIDNHNIQYYSERKRATETTISLVIDIQNIDYTQSFFVYGAERTCFSLRRVRILYYFIN